MVRVALRIATVVAVALVLCVPAAAGLEPAEDESSGLDASAEDSNGAASDALTSADDATAHVLFFSGGDLWRNGAFAHGGLLWAPKGLNADGPVFKLLLNGGLYRYHTGSTEVLGEQLMAAALPGWHFRRGTFDLTLFAGIDAQDHRFLPLDPGNRLAGTHLGLRAGFDVWYEPWQDAMLTGSVSVSTIGTGYWTRAAAGWRFFDTLWFGPEIHAGGDDIYRQFRFGVHVTSARIWGYEWSGGVGWVTDSDDRDGMYARLGVLVRK